VIKWTAPAFLVISVLLTFFSWNGAYPGGYDVYTQGPWRAISGAYSVDRVGEDVLHFDEPVAEGKKGLKEYVHSNLLMLPYILLLFFPTALAIALPILPALNLKLPPQLVNLMPYRMAIVAGLGLFLMVILGFQSMRGFGLENGIIDRIDESLKSEQE